MATKKRPAAAPSDRCDDCGKPATYRCNTTGRVDGTARCGDCHEQAVQRESRQAGTPSRLLQ
jgi:hypothetical protein